MAAHAMAASEERGALKLCCWGGPSRAQELLE
eukprot:CAMPEP_0168476760 /NCGR_PEP_ID=MMETSP0228-20121227/62052_1 /TAXON_ID=133427 /ORGANISM="Protoceratium reticulatum, Strain CCCM 535 (=CCMP 1889)" /LENGTH=31 /DNA_ID= /DNA_START= /DNA_END= /DNA_ORIENTATION=